MDKKMLRISISFCILIIMIGIGITYAYFSANFYNAESKSTIKVGSATISVVYEANTNDIVSDAVEPGWEGSKYFTISSNNTSNKDVTYKINLEVDNSNFYTTVIEGKSNLYYQLFTCTEKNGTSCSNITNSTLLNINSGTKNIYTTTITNGSNSIYYKLVLNYPNDEENYQSQYGIDDKLLNFSGHITITSEDKIYE